MRPFVPSSSAFAPAIEFTLRPRPHLIAAGLVLHAAVAWCALRLGGSAVALFSLTLCGFGFWQWLRMTGASLPGALRGVALHADGSWTLTDTGGISTAAELAGAPVVCPWAILLVWDDERGRRRFALCLPDPRQEARLRPLRVYLRSLRGT